MVLLVVLFVSLSNNCSKAYKTENRTMTVEVLKNQRVLAY